MGCDIHIAIERREKGGEWQRIAFVTRPRFTREADEDYFWREFDEARAAGAVEMPPCFDARNYALFGILANVRNGWGFAGTPTGEAWEPIAENRDFPPDATVTKDLWLGDHSFTWVGLDELRAFDWAHTVRRRRGIVAYDEWAKWQKSDATQPGEWASMIYGPEVEIITQGEATVRKDRLHKELHVESCWSVTALEATNDWWIQVEPVLTKIENGGELRLIMGFDS